jgi:hypothetical protein
MEVVLTENQQITDNEIVAGIIWEITWFAPTHAAHLRKLQKFKKGIEKK